MSKLTQSERLAVVEEQIKEIKQSITTGFNESKGFHNDLIVRLDVLLKSINEDREANIREISTLKEQVRAISKIVWLALSAAITGFVAALYQLISERL